MLLIIYIAIAAIVGGVFGYVGRHYIALLRRNSIESKLEERILEAKKTAQKIEEESLKFSEEVKQRLDKTESRLDKKEDELESREDALKIEKEKLFSAAEDIKEIKRKTIEKEKSIDSRIENIATLSKEDAKEILIKKIEDESAEDLKSRLLKLSREGEQKYESFVKEILVNTMYRVGNSNGITEFMTSVVEIHDDEIKGKVIGKEGRNIKAFERASGVEILVDEIPNAIVISCFDPVRRAIAKNALEMLIKDGRIQPAKIEEF